MRPHFWASNFYPKNTQNLLSETKTDTEIYALSYTINTHLNPHIPPSVNQTPLLLAGNGLFSGFNP